MKVERVIVLSWIQNLLKKIKKDEEEEINDLHIEKRDVSPPIRDEGGKELETRISYQYPKGSLSHTLPLKEAKKAQEQATQKRREQRHSEIYIQKSASARTVKADVPKPKKEVIPKKRGPFQPTEIPSPVFGFNRPKQSDQLVEHELKPFSIDSQKEPMELLESTEHQSNEMLHRSFEDILTNAISQYGQSEEDHIREEAIYEREQQKTLPVLNEENMINVPIQMPPIEEKSMSVEVVNQGIQEAAVSLEETNQQPNENVAVIEPSRSNRTNLPFNVVMLKQDKLRWEESKKRRKEAAVSLQQPQIEQLKSIRREETKKESIVQTNQTIIGEASQPTLGNQTTIREANQTAQGNQTTIREANQTAQGNQTTIREANQPAQGIQIAVREENQSTQSNQTTVDKERAALTGQYMFPATSLLNPPVLAANDGEWLHSQEEILNQTLQNFNVGASVVNVTQGPSVTRFEVQPEPGVKVNKITNLSDDIKLSLAARDIRIEAPIPGKHTIGIEVPNQKSRPVFINELIGSSVFRDAPSPLTAVLGLDISGRPIVTDLKKMPHGLIAGATGSGKSVCINSILVSLLFKASPEDLRLLLIDPKMVELAPYNHIPHLVSPVITDVKVATAALKWAVEEMERRYELFAHTGVRDISRFNELAIQHKRYSDKLPLIVIIIDELADLMMMSPADVEEAICRIAQKARACGIHLIVATQRPSVDVITGLIKANIPTRIAFSVSSQVDSRTIIDISGAEKLLGRGDMLFLENGSSKPVRLQGTFVSDEEIDLVVAHVREQREPEYLFHQEELLKKAQVSEEEDELFYEACEFIIDQGGASTSSLQRRFKIGYNRAARLMDMLERNGFISGANGSKPREVLISEEDLESIQDGGQ